MDAQNDIGQGIVDAQNALGQEIVDSQNALGQAVVGKLSFCTFFVAPTKSIFQKTQISHGTILSRRFTKLYYVTAQ